MRYIKPEIEIAYIETQDVITLSKSNILNWGNLTEEQQGQINVSGDGQSGNIDVEADFFG